MVFEELKDWAFALCLGFEEDNEELKTYGKSKKTEISVSLRNYAPSWKGGAQFISVSSIDKRDGFSGNAFPFDTLADAENCVFRLAKELGIKRRNTQLALF